MAPRKQTRPSLKSPLAFGGKLPQEVTKSPPQSRKSPVPRRKSPADAVTHAKGSSPAAHATGVRRAMSQGPRQTADYMHRLQQTHGNHFVQRVCSAISDSDIGRTDGTQRKCACGGDS